LRFVPSVKSGVAEISAPVYSHLTYDIVPGEQVVLRRPDIVLLEGLNVLQPARPRHNGISGLVVSDRAEHLWDTINGPNLEQNIMPTRGRATLVLHKDRDHSVRQIRLRKL
jgi:type I pantothenate kinase